MSGFLQTIILGITFVFCSNLAFANSTDLTTCPSVNDVKVSHFEMAAPYGYDAPTKSMKVLAIAEYQSDTHQIFDFLIYPIRVVSGETLVNNVNVLIAQLQPEADTPFTYHINDEEGSVSVCAYRLPSDASVTAFLVADDSDIESDRDFSSKKRHQVSLRQLFVKQLVLK